jgi:hypothetical protein
MIVKVYKKESRQRMNPKPMIFTLGLETTKKDNIQCKNLLDRPWYAQKVADSVPLEFLM